MKSRIAVTLSALALLVVLALPASAADPQYVPLGQYGNVALNATWGGVWGLTISTVAPPYGPLATYDCSAAPCKPTLELNHDGRLRLHAIATSVRPRLQLDSQGYTGADVLRVNIGGSTVSSLGPNGQFESYSYYHGSCCDYGQDEMFVVEGRQDEALGGIDSAGRYFTRAIKPDGTVTAQPPNASAMDVGSARLWFDPTPVTGGMMSTMKFADGSVKTVKLG